MPQTSAYHCGTGVRPITLVPPLPHICCFRKHSPSPPKIRELNRAVYRVEVGQPGIKWRMFQEQCRKEQRELARQEKKSSEIPKEVGRSPFVFRCVTPSHTGLHTPGLFTVRCRTREGRRIGRRCLETHQREPLSV